MFFCGFIVHYESQRRRDCTSIGGEIAQKGGEIAQMAIFECKWAKKSDLRGWFCTNFYEYEPFFDL